ncbi:MAG: Uncharacterized protein FD130_2321 [Halothiobacillaceae bacterium]|nr:MAG: Uncharacterized protein FD130_2321 [Halothiobacillaceae bacterium]
MNSLLFDFSTTQIGLTLLLFVWAGFVRSGLGFGGAALGLPLLLFVYDRPLFWLPVIGAHLLFFSALTLRTRLHDVDWGYLKKTSLLIVPAALVGVLGLITLPNLWLLVFIYSVSLFYGMMWLMNVTISSHKVWVDRLLLIIGGYVAGTSLTGAPLMVAVFMRNVAVVQLRNTLFVLWFVLVAIKMTTFAVLEVPLHWQTALLLLPAAAIGHLLGLKVHDLIMRNDRLFKQVIGGVLAVVSLLGLANING